MTAMSTPPPARLGRATPIRRVANLGASLDDYVHRPGFTIRWQHPSRFACVVRAEG